MDWMGWSPGGVKYGAAYAANNEEGKRARDIGRNSDSDDATTVPDGWKLIPSKIMMSMTVLL